MKPNPQDVRFNNCGADPIPGRAVTATKQRGVPAQHTSSGIYNTNHSTYHGHNSQCTQRKDVPGIYTKTSPHTKNIRLTSSTLGCFHIYTVLQNHSRWLSLLNSYRQKKLRKIKKQRHYFQLKEQEKYSERTHNEADLTSLLDPRFKKEVIKM